MCTLARAPRPRVAFPPGSRRGLGGTSRPPPGRTHRLRSPVDRGRREQRRGATQHRGGEGLHIAGVSSGFGVGAHRQAQFSRFALVPSKKPRRAAVKRLVPAATVLPKMKKKIFISSPYGHHNVVSLAREMWQRQGSLLLCTWLLHLAVLSLSSPASSVQTSEHGKACLSQHGPDIAILHPPDGFLVEDPAKLMVAFYVSSFCVSRLGDKLKVGAAPSALPSP